MPKTDSLLQLIASLNSTEKRLFKMYVSSNSGGKATAYLDLFNAYSKLKNYTEKEFLKKLPKGYATKNLAQQKKYLKDLILKCMRELDDNRAEDTVNELMREHVFLGKKNLIKEQWKKLQKAKEVATKYELFSSSMDILDAEMTFLIERDFDRSLDFTSHYVERKRKILAKIELLSELTSVKHQIFQLLRRYKKNISKEQLTTADRLVKSIDVDGVLAFNSFRLNMTLYNLLGNHADLHRKMNDVVENRFKMVQLCQQYPWMIESNTKQYMISYFNYISALFGAEDLDKVKDELEAIEKLKLSTENDRGEFFQNITLYKILYWVNTGKLDEAAKEKDFIEQGVKTYRNKINASSLLSIYYNYALTFFCNGNFEECINWLERMYTVKKDVRRDLKVFARVLRVICHFQLENYLLIESLVRSVRRGNTLIPIYNNILSNVLASSNKGAMDAEAMRKLHDEVLKESWFVGNDIVRLWLNALQSKRSVNDLYRESIA